MNGDLPLASDEAHAMLYELLCQAFDEREGLDGLEGGAERDQAPPDP